MRYWCFFAHGFLNVYDCNIVFSSKLWFPLLMLNIGNATRTTRKAEEERLTKCAIPTTIQIVLFSNRYHTLFASLCMCIHICTYTSCLPLNPKDETIFCYCHFPSFRREIVIFHLLNAWHTAENKRQQIATAEVRDGENNNK